MSYQEKDWDDLTEEEQDEINKKFLRFMDFVDFLGLGEVSGHGVTVITDPKTGKHYKASGFERGIGAPVDPDAELYGFSQFEGDGHIFQISIDMLPDGITITDSDKKQIEDGSKKVDEFSE